ncbi:MAG: helix-turn-helix domain-containing GNAT family N-acetyltransferase [Neomegalonema sp.]|nr:helix-turn-helix domain-containing GNAT family N-acetyltransferase [Neomegalonema sp.]
MDMQAIARLRRFNRIVTAELGALDSSFLGRGRPLGAARVLNAIGQGLTDISEIRDYLKLDSGLTSRLLRGLEKEGLATTTPNPTDARRRHVRLTPAGQKEYDAYEQLSNQQAHSVLARHPAPAELLAAVDLVATAYAQGQCAIEERDPRCDDARSCLAAYYAELSQRLARGFDVSLSRDPEAEDMIRPRGVFLVAYSEGLPVGCVGLKGSGGKVAEIKRLWIAPSCRGFGVARRMMAQAEQIARALGVDTLRLDTNSALREASHLYQRCGWVEIDRFNDDPYPDLFFEKQL